jgi:hypothetical protein
MRQIKIATVPVMFLLMSSTIFSQHVNWKSLEKDERHLINVNAGVDFGLTAGAGYGYQLKTKMPIILNVEFSAPAGDKISDDFKTKIGGYIRLYEVNNFQFGAKVQGVFRRFENSFVNLLNFGSDMAAFAGYYRPKWFLAGEAGFDKAIVTHFKHTAAYKENFPSVKDGWYEPATGGNFYYGFQTGYSFGRNDLSLKAGKILNQDFSSKPLLPFYLQVGYTIKLR